MIFGAFAISFGLAACGSAPKRSSGPKAHINNKTKFSSKTFGVKASPRISTSRQVRKGGGRRQIGRAYKIRGKWYRPKEEKNYNKTGKASWYGPNFHGRLTANGEIYDQYALSGAHPTFPLPSYARVTNRANGNSVVVRVNDRGPYAHGRIIDLSSRAADVLDYKKAGIANVRVQYLGQAPLHGRDSSYLIASIKTKNSRGRYLPRPGLATVPGVLIASAGTSATRPVPAAALGPIAVARRSQPVAAPLRSVTLAFAAPVPKERPVYSGGGAFEMFGSQNALTRPKLISPQAALPMELKKRLQNVLTSDEIRRRFIISAFIAEGRISTAHEAAKNVATPSIGRSLLVKYWKRQRNDRSGS